MRLCPSSTLFGGEAKARETASRSLSICILRVVKMSMRESESDDVVGLIKAYLMKERSDLGMANITETTRLIDDGILDSMFILQLVSFLEDQFLVQIAAEDIVPENFDSIVSIERLLLGKRSPP